MRAYYYDNIPGDQRLPHDYIPSRPVSSETLKALGVSFWTIPIEGYESNINEIADERGYRNRDIINVTKEGLGEVRKNELVSSFDLTTYYDRHMRRKSRVSFKSALGENFLFTPLECIYFFRHLHEDEEIRYVLSGSGFFDVRGM